jgi:hypothetical protein
MKKEKLTELAEKLGMNKAATEFGLKTKPKETEKQIVDAAKFMGLIKKGEK